MKEFKTLLNKTYANYNKCKEKLQDEEYSNSRSHKSSTNRITQRIEKIDGILYVLEKSLSYVRLFCSNIKKKTSSNYSNCDEPELTKTKLPSIQTDIKEEIRLIEKLLAKLNEYPNDLIELIYLLEKGSEKVHNKKVYASSNKFKANTSKTQLNSLNALVNKTQNSKKQIKQQNISKIRIRNMRKMTRFQRLKNRLDNINSLQKPEDSHNVSKSSGVDSVIKEIPFPNYTITIKREREESKEEEQGNHKNYLDMIKLNEEEFNRIILQSSEDSQNRSSEDSSDNGSKEDSNLNDSK